MKRVNYFPALSGIRAIAAYMVFIHHKNPFSVEVFGNVIHNFFAEFHVGVTIFFVLSGFLIANRYFEYDNFNYKSYLIKRFARIYPMYFILTTITFIFFAKFQLQSSFDDFKIYLTNITFIRGYFDDLKFSGIPQGWSLSVEEFFYFAAPLFFLLIKKNKTYLIIIPFFTIILGILFVNTFSSNSNFGLMNNYNFMFDFTIFGRITEFFIGISLYIVIKKNLNFPKFINFTIFGLILMFFWILILSFIKPENGFGTDVIFGKIINTFLLPLFGIAPLFYGLVKEKTIFSECLSSKLFQLLGKSSYVFYLIHLGIFVIIIKKLSDNQIFLFVTLNLISIFLYLYVERSLNIFFRKNNLLNE